MLCTVKIKLLTTVEQHSWLLETMKQFNFACNYISNIAFNIKNFSKFALQQVAYYEVREKFGLSSQMVVRAMGKVVESYKTDKKSLHTFKDTGAMVYDDRILSFKGLNIASILTLNGRIEVPMFISEYHKGVLQGKRVCGQADLILQDGVFYLLLIVDFPEHEYFSPSGFIGVDLGIKNIAVDSTGETFSGDKVNGLRKRHSKLRKRLQSKGTKSAKHLLKKRKHKEQLFARDVNHCISKKIVAKAKAQNSGIALEDLKGIRERITVKKSQRRQHSSWAFNQLRQFIEYKAALSGILVIAVDPRNTSRTCPSCSYISKSNRPNRDTFCCQQCGFSGLADNIAAINIGSRASVNMPYVGTAV
jgi:IS605 OrfB family transposase